MAKLDRIKKAYEAAQASIQDLRNDIAALEIDRENEKKNLELAAGKGDEAAYKQALENINDIKMRIHMKKKMLENTAAPVSDKDAAAAWKEYITKGDERFNTALNEYKEARAAAKGKLDELIGVLTDNFNAREQCALYSTGSRQNTQPYEMKTINSLTMPEDIKFFYFRANTPPQEQNEYSKITMMLHTQHTIY